MYKKLSEYYQEMPQSQSTDQPTVPQGKEKHPHNSKYTIMLRTQV